MPALQDVGRQDVHPRTDSIFFCLDMLCLDPTPTYLVLWWDTRPYRYTLNSARIALLDMAPA